MSDFLDFMEKKEGLRFTVAERGTGRMHGRPYFLFDVIPVHPMTLETFTEIHQVIRETLFDEPFVDGVNHSAAVEFSDVHGMHITGETSRDGYDHILDALRLNDLLPEVRIRYLPPERTHWVWRPGTKMDGEVIGGISRRHM